MNYQKRIKKCEGIVKWLDRVNERSDLPDNARDGIKSLRVQVSKLKDTIKEGDIKEGDAEKTRQLQFNIEINMVNLLRILFGEDAEEG